MSTENSQSRKLFIMRHGERIDFVFARDWIDQCFDESGNYTPTDLNMPETLPQRSQGYSTYLYDSPLTKIGLYQAELTGQAFKKAKHEITHVYCSPAFRCIQTGDAFLKACDKRNDIKIRIEPGLFEFLGWYSGIVPNWMTPEEIASAGYNIDLEYKPIMTIEKLASLQEKQMDQFYSRSASVTKDVCNSHKNSNILFVGHSSTLDVCARGIMGKKSRYFNDLFKIIGRTPYCGIVQLDQEGSQWVIKGRPILSITHATNENFDYTIMLE